MLPPRRYIFNYVQYNAHTEQCQPVSQAISQFFAIFVKQKGRALVAGGEIEVKCGIRNAEFGIVTGNVVVGEAMSLPPVLHFPYRSIFVHVGANCVRPAGVHMHS